MDSKPSLLDILPASIIVVALILLFSPSGPLPAWQARILAKPPQIVNFGEFNFKVPEQYSFGTNFIIDDNGNKADIRVIDTTDIEDMFAKLTTNIRGKLEVSKETTEGNTTKFQLEDKDITISKGTQSIIIISSPKTFSQLEIYTDV